LEFLATFFKNLITSFIVTGVISFLGLCFFTGKCPPDMAKLKAIYNQYQAMTKMIQASPGTQPATQLAAQPLPEVTKAQSPKPTQQQTYDQYMNELEKMDHSVGKKQAENEKPAEPPQPPGNPKWATAQALSNAPGKEVVLITNDPHAAAQVAGGRDPQSIQPPQPGQIPKAWQDEFYHMKLEVYKLQQRVQELEKKQALAK
jgi:hypothetical protein